MLSKLSAVVAPNKMPTGRCALVVRISSQAYMETTSLAERSAIGMSIDVKRDNPGTMMQRKITKKSRVVTLNNRLTEEERTPIITAIANTTKQASIIGIKVLKWPGTASSK